MSDDTPTSGTPVVVALIVIWSLGISATSALGLPWFAAPLSLLGVAVLFAALASLSQESAAAGVLVLLTWLIVGLLEALEGPLSTFAVAYLVPLALGFTYGLVNRLLRLRDAQDVALALAGVIKSAPLVAPVVLIVLFLPALSSDVWRIAGELTPESLLVVGALSIGLLFVVVRIQLGSQVEPMIAQRAEHLTDLGIRPELTRKQVSLTNDDETKALLDEISDPMVDSSWPVAGEEYAPYLQAAVGKTLEAPLTGRLALTVGAIGLLFTGYIYLLCNAVVPIETATEWSQTPAPFTTIEVLGVSSSLAGGPYLGLAALLGLAATATFLSFALVEARFAQALTDALLRDPTDRLLVLALPYVKLWEDAIEMGRQRQVETDLCTPPQGPDS